MRKFNFKIPVTIFREGDSFISYSPALDLSTTALTFEETKKRFAEAVNIFFEEIEKMGTLEKVLADLGWRKVENEWRPMTPIVHEMQQFQVNA